MSLKQVSFSLPMRQRLFRVNPHCFWCGVLTVLDGMRLPNFATVDHLYSRWHPERRARHVNRDGTLHVLACQNCNQERALAESQCVPFIPKLKDKLEFAQKADATLARGVKLRPAERVVVSPEHPAVVPTLVEEFQRANPRRVGNLI
jgi:hypothetical protein